MNKQGGFAMSGMAILGICLVVIGLLTIGYGVVAVGISLNMDFQTLLVGGLIIILIGAALIPGLPAVVKLTALALTTLSLLMYIHMMPDLEFMLMLISDVVVLGFAAWFAILFLRK
ncbi:hypothetical protein MK370_06390 [Streptococcus sanguinis]|uniref:hypothetical protein n=1 Tax=Streptococcus sanguinis TaxID=1305 RepID=UPI0022841A82|nr:hypothetical protein [Streptococcus sanguinis]MCY7041164.1 hypothetical protein [Streptococcus sanguinis]